MKSGWINLKERNARGKVKRNGEEGGGFRKWEISQSVATQGAHIYNIFDGIWKDEVG